MNRLLTLTGCLFVLCGQACLAEEPNPDQVRFFEEKIRPVIAEHCYECHSDKKQQGDLRFDRRDAVIPHAVKPGQPDQSRFLQVLKYDPNDTQMPPKGKLPQDKIDLLTEWVRMGAPWPADKPGTAHSSGFARRENGEIDFNAVAQTHWAYRPIARPIPPRAHSQDRVITPVDNFVLNKLEEKQMTLAPESSRDALVRRLYEDLLGLRPTYEQVQAFTTDDSPTAVNDLVEQLLASPEFGEKWARMWLDISRYADTKGYVFTDERRFAFSYTYRDYVIDAFNSDKPYDQFIIEQLAADKLNLPPMSPQLAAMGFLTLGPRFIGDNNAIIDDRIDVVTRGLMGMTTSCARCHDHKYDPVPTQDYYSLYGVFASCREPEELPQIGEADKSSPEYLAFEAERAKRQKEVDDYLDGAYKELQDHSRNRAGEFLIALAQKANLVPGDIKFDPPLRDKQLELWQKYLEREMKPENRIWGALFKLKSLPAGEFAVKAAEQIATYSPENTHPAILNALKSQPPQNYLDVVKLYGRVLEDNRKLWEQEKAAHPEWTVLPDGDAEQMRQVLFGEKSPAAFPRDQIERYYGRDHREKSRDLRKKVAELVVTSPGSPPHGMVLVDNDQPTEPVVFERGNPGRRGPQVPRRMLRIVAGNDSPAFQNGSGRLELAQRIASKDNPLTARVFVNRVWLQLMGTALVNSPSDFGVRTDPPTHPEMLDWLSGRFIDSGWSVKTLIREIVLSSTYRQSIIHDVKAESADPENRLYWKQNRKRFQFEQMRDSMLAAAGVLDDRMTGRPVEIEKRQERKERKRLDKKISEFLGLDSQFTARRSIYSFIDRNNFSSLLRTFDYPSPDSSSPQRPNTVVPQQALFGLNSPFVSELSKIAAERVTGDTPDAKIRSLFQLTLAREPAAEEASWSVSYLERHPDGLWQVAQVLLLSNEFQFTE